MLLSNIDIASAEVFFSDEKSGPQLELNMTASGNTKLAQITEQNLHKPIAILVDQRLISAPIVQEKITGGMLKISGITSVAEAKRIVDEMHGK